jgi:hypothetical protein
LQFYLVFALASMYIAMLMTGWGSQAGEAKVGPVPDRRRLLCAAAVVEGSRASCRVDSPRSMPHPVTVALCTVWLAILRASPPLLALIFLLLTLTLFALSPSLPQYLINVGWTSVWVKVVSQWVTVGLYCWTLVAPVLFPDRDFS